jgi:hypothetical protein
MTDSWQKKKNTNLIFSKERENQGVASKVPPVDLLITHLLLT